MKKSGAVPTVNTYVELAHALNTVYSKQKYSTPPKARRILTLLERLDAQNLPDWGKHKGIGVFLNVLYSAAKNAREFDPEELYPLVNAAKSVWDRADPLRPNSPLSDSEKEHALVHFLDTLRLSRNQEDLQKAADMLPQLAKFPSILSRRCALRIAEKFPRAILAKQYWKHFSHLPYDQSSSELYLFNLSKSENNADEALQTISDMLEKSPNGILAKNYVNALLCCVQPPNIDVARSIYQHFCKDPKLSEDFGVHKLLVGIFRKALRFPHILKTHPPEKIYSIIREIQFPRLLSRKDIDSDVRITLLNRILEIMDWRFKGHLDDATRQFVAGDLKFARRWRAIINNEDKTEKTHPNVGSSDSSPGQNSGEIDSSSSVGQGRYVFRGGRLVLRQQYSTPPGAATTFTQNRRDVGTRDDTLVAQQPPSNSSRARLALNENKFHRKSSVDDKFMSRLAAQHRLRQPARSPLPAPSRHFSTVAPRYQLKSRTAHRKPQIRQKRERGPVINPDIMGPDNFSTGTLRATHGYVSASREDISLDESAWMNIPVNTSCGRSLI